MSEQKKIDGSMESVTLGKVPQKDRKSWVTIMLIQAGIMVSVPCLMVGSTMATCLDLPNAIIAVAVGFAIAVFFMTLIGMQSSDLGRPMCVAASSAFGKTGVRIFLMTLFSCALVCWFGYQSVVCGQAFSNLMGQFFGIDIDVNVSIIVWGIIMMLTAVWGINALGWLNNVAIPALLIVIVVAAVICFNTYDVSVLASYGPPAETQISLLAGVAMAFGGQSCGMVVTGDITRFQKTRKDTILSTVIGVFPVSLLMIVLGYMLAVMTGDSDISNILCTLGLPVLGMLVLILATWTTNTTNSSSAGIDMVMLFGTSEKSRSVMTLIAGAVGTILALTGIMNTFMDFLNICGAAFGPVAGVIVADYWIVRKGNPDNWFYKTGFDWVGIVSWLAGVLFTVLVLTDYSVFLGIVLSFVLYIALRKVVPEKRNVAEEEPEAAEEAQVA